MASLDFLGASKLEFGTYWLVYIWVRKLVHGPDPIDLWPGAVSEFEIGRVQKSSVSLANRTQLSRILTQSLLLMSLKGQFIKDGYELGFSSPLRIYATKSLKAYCSIQPSAHFRYIRFYYQ